MIPPAREGPRPLPVPDRPGLLRAIGRWDLVALTINGIIGAGIFGLPSKVFSLAGTYSVLVFLACVAVVSLRVLCYAEVGSRFTETGGAYLYARRTFGPLVGFEVGWLDWISTVASAAAACNLFIDYLGWFRPEAGQGAWRGAIITAVIVLLAAINLAGVRDAAIVGNVFTIAKLIPLLLFVGAGLFFLEPRNFSIASVPGFGQFSRAALLLLFAFGGFGSAVVPAGEMRDPRRSVPFALLTATAIVAALYTLIQIVCIGTLPGLAESQRPLADAAGRFLGRAGGTIVAAGALISVLGLLHVLMLATPRLPFAMAEQGQAPRVLAAIHPRLRTPHVAILASAAVMLTLAMTGTFLYAATISTVARLLIMVTTFAALPVLRVTQRERPAQFVVPGGWIVSAAAIALCAWLLSSSPLREARDVGIAAAAGLVLFLSYRAFGARR